MRQETAPKPAAGIRKAALAAFLWSLTAVPVGLWQLLDPEGGPFAEPLNEPTVSLPSFLDGPVAAVLLIAAGVAGLFLARARRSMWPATAAFAVVFGMLIPGISVMALSGYLTAFVLPVVLVAGPVLLARGRVGKLLAAAAVAAAVVALAIAGPLAPSVVADLLSNLGSGVAKLGWYPLAELWSAAGGACWAALTISLLVRAREGRRRAHWLTPEGSARWGRAAAYIAFACALPYGLTRLTWLTPWPFLLSAEELEANPDLRVWGLLLGFACLGGGVLCLGLAHRWGERWPYWVPRAAGRPVPPLVAIVPGSIMAYMFTIAAIPFAVLGFRQDEAWMGLVGFPFWAWGPALGAATLAYAVKRGVIRSSD